MRRLMAGALLALLAAGSPAGATDVRPNILLLTIDTIRADSFRSTGHFRTALPFLESIAARSTVFENAYSTSSWTVPAVTSMLTGLYPWSHGVVHGAVSRGEAYDQEIVPGHLPTLAEELQKLGYRTFGVTANAHLGPDLGYGRGFDRYICVGVESADAVNATLLKWRRHIEAADGPVFIWVHYYDPHHPYVEHREWFADFAGGLDVPDRRLLRLAKKSPPTPPRARSDRPRFAEIARALYDTELRYTDAHIESLYTSLPELQGFVTVMTGDHGEEFLEHGEVIHCRNLFNETVQVPLFVYRPGQAGGRSPSTVSLIDVPVTILEIAGGAVPESWPGVSLLQAPAGGARDRVVFAELARNADTGVQRALIGRRWKLIRHGEQDAAYDLQTDPGEQSPLPPEAARESLGGLEAFLDRLAPPPEEMKRLTLSKEIEIILRGEGYIR